jgi:ribosomal protein L13
MQQRLISLFGERFGASPTAVVEMAGEGILPKNRLGRAMRKKLAVYAEEPPARGGARGKREDG